MDNNTIGQVNDGLELDADIAALLQQALLVSDVPLKQRMADAEDRMAAAERAKKVAESTRDAIDQSTFENGDLLDARAMYTWMKDEAKKHNKSLPHEFVASGEKAMQFSTALDTLEARLQISKPSAQASADVMESYEKGATAARNTLISASRQVVQAFFQQLKMVAHDVFGETINRAELERLSALSETEQGRELAHKHGLHIQVKAAPDSVENSKEVFERQTLKALLSGPEIQDEEKRIEEVCKWFGVSTFQEVMAREPILPNGAANIHKSQYSNVETEEQYQKRCVQVLEVHAAYPLLQYEKSVILPGLARMHADRIAAYAATTYPDDKAKQRLLFEASKRHVRHPFFEENREKGSSSEPRKFNNYGSGNHGDDKVVERLKYDSPKYTFSTDPLTKGITKEDQDVLNSEWLRVRALRGVLLSSRAKGIIPYMSASSPHSSQQDVFGGIAAVDQYLAYRSNKRTSVEYYPNQFIVDKGYHIISDTQHLKAINFSLYNPLRNRNGGGRDDSETLTQTDPTFAHDVMAIQAMERQVLERSPQNEQAMFVNCDWTPVFQPLFDYRAPDGTIYASGKREEQQAHFNRMKAFFGSFERDGANATAIRTIATIEDAATIAEEYRLRALGVVAQLDTTQRELQNISGSLSATNAEKQSIAGRVAQLQADIAQLRIDLEQTQAAMTQAQQSSHDNSQALNASRRQAQEADALRQRTDVEKANEQARIQRLVSEARALLGKAENANGIMAGKERAALLAAARAKLEEI